MKNVNCFYSFALKSDSDVDEVTARMFAGLRELIERYVADGLIEANYRFDSEIETLGNIEIPENAVAATLNFDDIFVPKSNHF